MAERSVISAIVLKERFQIALRRVLLGSSISLFDSFRFIRIVRDFLRVVLWRIGLDLIALAGLFCGRLGTCRLPGFGGAVGARCARA